MRRLWFFLLFYGISAKLQLAVITMQSCGVCQSWYQEVYPVYVKQQVEKNYPELLLLDVEKDWSYIQSNFKNIHSAPTFILLDDGREKTRFIGYYAGSPERFFSHLESALG